MNKKQIKEILIDAKNMQEEMLKGKTWKSFHYGYLCGIESSLFYLNQYDQYKKIGKLIDNIEKHFERN